MVNGSTTADRDLAAELAEFEALPILHEDDPERDMGEANFHALAEHLLRYGIAACLAPRPQFRVFSNLNLYYQQRFPTIYIAPDIMVVQPLDSQREDVAAYYLGRDGPAPVFATEVTSERTALVRDLGEKLYIYAMISVKEYLIVDLARRFQPQQLLLKRLQPNRTWKDEQDPDGGITSRLGFRVIVDTDGRLRVLDAKTGKRYVRPDEADARVAALEAELSRLQQAASQPPVKKKGTKRRKKL